MRGDRQAAEKRRRRFQEGIKSTAPKSPGAGAGMAGKVSIKIWGKSRDLRSDPNHIQGLEDKDDIPSLSLWREREIQCAVRLPPDRCHESSLPAWVSGVQGKRNHENERPNPSAKGQRPNAHAGYHAYLGAGMSPTTMMEGAKGKVVV